MLGVGTDLKDHQVPTPPYHVQGHFPLHQVAQGLIQETLKENFVLLHLPYFLILFEWHIL